MPGSGPFAGLVDRWSMYRHRKRAARNAVQLQPEKDEEGRTEVCSATCDTKQDYIYIYIYTGVRCGRFWELAD